MKMTTILIFFLLVFEACAMRTIENQFPKESRSRANVGNANQTKESEVAGVKNDIEKPLQIDDYNIENSLGLVSLNEERYKGGDFVSIYNQEGGLWYKFIYFDDKGNAVAKSENEDFHPFRYSLNDLFLYFNCVGEDRVYYHVVVNEEKGLRKYIRKDDRLFKFQTWEQYVLNCFAVGLNLEQNPLRETPNGQIIVGHLPRSFYPEEITGEWLRVRWYDDNDEEKKSPKFGWARWKMEGKIIVNFFETA